MNIAKKPNVPTLAGMYWFAAMPFAQAKDYVETATPGVNTAGQIRVNNLANLEALLNVFSSSAEVIGTIVGIYFLYKAVRIFANSRTQAMSKAFKGIAFITTGLMIPGCINWLVASARDTCCF